MDETEELLVGKKDGDIGLFSNAAIDIINAAKDIELDVTDTDEGFVAKLYPVDNRWVNTLGYTLRRAVMSCGQGIAPVTFAVEGALHPYGSVKGIKEDVLQIGMNISKIQLLGTCSEPDFRHFTVEGPKELKVKDLCLPYQVLDDSLHICSITGSGTFNIDITFMAGIGYTSRALIPDLIARSCASVNSTMMVSGKLPQGHFPIAATFAPVSSVVYVDEPIEIDGNPNFRVLIVRCITGFRKIGTGVIQSALQMISNVFSNINASIQCVPGITIKKMKGFKDYRNDTTLLVDLVEHHTLRDDNYFTEGTLRILSDAGIDTVNALCSTPLHVIKSMPGIGGERIKKIRTAMLNYLGMDPFEEGDTDVSYRRRRRAM